MASKRIRRSREEMYSNGSSRNWTVNDSRELNEGPVKGHLGGKNKAENPLGNPNPQKEVRLGYEYQAEIPSYDPNPPPNSDDDSKDALMWSPCDLPEAQVNEYTYSAMRMHGCSLEQALGVLASHDHSIESARADLSNFTPLPDDWSTEDTVLFDWAFSLHGKNFRKIQQMLPGKTIPSLVKFYYTWKMMLLRTSVMDRHVLKHLRGDGMEEEEEEQGCCSHCGPLIFYKNTGRRPLCSSCIPEWSTRDVKSFMENTEEKSDRSLKVLEEELRSLKYQANNNQQVLSLQKKQLGNGVRDFMPAEVPTSTEICSRWTRDEQLLAVQGIRRYGKDFQAIAEVIGNKEAAHVRHFFKTFQRRYNLDEVLADYKEERGTQVVASDDDNEEEGDATVAGAAMVGTVMTRDRNSTG